MFKPLDSQLNKTNVYLKLKINYGISLLYEQDKHCE